MAAIQINIRGQGNVPDAAVAAIRARVTALVQACTDAGAPEHFLRVDFAPLEDPIPLTAPATAAEAQPSAPAVPFEAAVLERPTPRRAPIVPPELKPPDVKEDP